MVGQSIYYIILGIGVFLLAVVLIPSKKKKKLNSEKLEKSEIKKTVLKKHEKEYSQENLPIGKIKGDSHYELIQNIKNKNIAAETLIDEEFFEDADDSEMGESIDKYFSDLFQAQEGDKVEIEILSNRVEDYIENEEEEATEFQNDLINERVAKNEIEDFYKEMDNNINKSNELLSSVGNIFEEHDFDN